MRTILLIFLLAASGGAQGADVVHITYHTFGLVGSIEESHISISRTATPVMYPRRSRVDQLFDAINNVLQAAHVAPRWEQVPAIHSNTVKLEVILGTRTYLLSTGYGADGPEVHIGASDSDRRHLEALRKVLQLCTDHLRDVVAARKTTQ